MKTAFYLALLTPYLLLCQPNVTKNIGDFTELKVYDLLNVELTPSDTNRIEIFGVDAGQVQVINKNGTLKLRMALPRTFDGADINATLYYKSLFTVDANEGAVVYSSSPIQATSFECRAQEGARIELSIDASFIESKSYSGGVINLSGMSDKHAIKVNTGGVVNAQKLQTTDTDVRIRAGGEVNCYVTGLLTTDIKAGGDVHVYGSPKTVSKSNLIGGRVVLMN